MPQHLVKLIEHVFSVKAAFTKVGTTSSQVVDATLDTGASSTCVSFSVVQQLGISPSGSFELADTASGVGFSRPYPIEICVDQKLHAVTSCSVLFKPSLFLTVPSKNKFLTDLEVKAIAIQNGRTMPDKTYQKSFPRPGSFLVQVFQPGVGVEQRVALIGMNFLSQFDWQFAKSTQELTIHYP